MSSISPAQSDADIQRCFPVMVQLRSHLVAVEFVARVRRQQRAGYELAFVEHDGAVKAVAGFRLMENLPWGKFLYVDDLVTDEAVRSHGHGQKIFAWLIERARAAGCAEFHLDSGVQRFGAHRFYLGQRMDISAHHFALKLS